MYMAQLPITNKLRVAGEILLSYCGSGMRADIASCDPVTVHTTAVVLGEQMFLRGQCMHGYWHLRMPRCQKPFVSSVNAGRHVQHCPIC